MKAILDKVGAATFLCVLALMCSPAPGQSFKTLYSFGATPNFTNIDGAGPRFLMVSDGALFGMTYNGGSNGYGSVFRVNTDGTGFTNLHSFTSFDGRPWGGLVMVSNRIYGSSRGLSGSAGIVFVMNVDGSGYTNLHVFGTQGYSPTGGLIASGNTLFGTTTRGSNVFRLQTDGSGFTYLSGGSYAYGRLTLSGEWLYGTIGEGGPGKIFAVTTNGTGYTNLYTLGGSNGVQPYAGVVLAGDTLYGATLSGGISNQGTVYAAKTDGSDFKVLHSFGGVVDEAGAWGELVLMGRTLYGTTAGTLGYGPGFIYSINVDGTGFTVLHNFAVPTTLEGGYPLAGLVLYSNILYGTTFHGGQNKSGTIFAITLPPPQLAIVDSLDSVILSWPTNMAGFHVQSCTNLESSSAWETDYADPVVVDGVNTVTNAISEAQRFYRLVQ